MAGTNRHAIHQLEVQWEAPESFQLAIQHTIDGDRVITEAAEREADKQLSDKLQRNML